MTNPKTSIRAIAKELGISITTVSFVINGRAREKKISEITINRVKDLIQQKSYVPNSLAQNLRTGKSNIVGFLVDDISKPFFSAIARHIAEKFSQKGFQVIYSSTNKNIKKATELLDIFRDRSVDGYIIAAVEGLEVQIETLIQNEIPVVLFDRSIPQLTADYVLNDEEASAYLGTKHLIDNGYKNIGFLSLDPTQSQMIGRLKGYEKAITENGLQPTSHFLYHQEPAECIDNIIEFLKINSTLDAVFFAANSLTLYGLQALKKMGVRIPQDLAIVSFDDMDIFEFCFPTITAVAQPITAIAENLIDILIKKLNKKRGGREHQRIAICSELVIRDSSLPKAKVINRSEQKPRAKIQRSNF